MSVRVGILGGGQLARMMALAGAPLGMRFRVVDTAADACAGQVAPLVRADFTDERALRELAAAVDVVTFDFENVPAESGELVARAVPVFPAPAVLAIAQDRLAEKRIFQALGIPTARYAPVGSREELAAALATVGAPAILKTRRLGYDGKGHFRIAEAAEADAAWAALGRQASTVGLILEEMIAFASEVSVIAVRDRAGVLRAWPVTRNWHVDGILSASLAPAPVDEAIAGLALAHARALAEHLGYVGVFALEMFERDGVLLGNEMAPRVHNSGHWTIEGAVCSQFENHLRAVAGLPLGSTEPVGPSCMLNWIGELPELRPALAIPGLHWHDYGKTPRPGRKVGHATAVAPDAAALAAILEVVADRLGRRDQVAPVLAVL